MTQLRSFQRLEYATRIMFPIMELTCDRLKALIFLPYSPTCKASISIQSYSVLTNHSTPDNVDFFIDDIRRKEWWHCTQPYDYIHTRMSLGIFRDFREIIQKGFNNLDPGGWMESQEIYPKVYFNEGIAPTNYELLEWSKLTDEAAMKLGMPLRIANKLKTWYEQAGFVDVREEVFSLPINTWPKDPQLKLLGRFQHMNMKDGVFAWTVEYFVKAFGWTPTEVEVYLAHLRTSLADKSVHAFYRV